MKYLGKLFDVGYALCSICAIWFMLKAEWNAATYFVVVLIWQEIKEWKDQMYEERGRD